MKYHSDSYNTYFEELFELDACTAINKLKVGVSYEECSLFAEGIFTEGLSPAITRVFESFRYLITLREQINDTGPL